MADRQPAPRPATATATATATARPARSTQPPTTLLRRVVQSNAPTSTQVVGFLTLVLSVTALLLLTGVTLTGAAAGLVLLVPLALLTSPVWVPAAVTIFSAIAAALCACGFFVAGVAGGTWMYRYFTGRHPVGADRVDYARSRIADTASHVKDYVKGVKDAAPGA